MRVQEYIQEDGSNPYQAWFDSLNAMAAVKITIDRSRLEVGNTSNVKWFDGIGEYRIDWGPGYRIYLMQDGQDVIMLFGGGTKSGSRRILLKRYGCAPSISSASSRRRIK